MNLRNAESESIRRLVGGMERYSKFGKEEVNGVNSQKKMCVLLAALDIPYNK